MRKYFFLVVLFCIHLAITAQVDTTIYQIVEEMPRFPGCENVLENAKHKQCSNSMLVAFLFRHLKISSILREDGMATIN